MNTLLSLFLLFLNHSLHQDVYYQITQFVYEHLEEMDNYSMTALADACHTSTVTIKKWMELFGLDNYKRFKERLRDTSLIRLAQIDARCQKVRSEQLVEKIRLLSGKKAINQDMFLAAIDQLLEDLAEACHVYLCKATFPLALSLSFAKDMRLLGKRIYFKQIGFRAEFEQLKTDDLIILVTVTGRILSQNKSYFLKLYRSPAKKVIMTQNEILHTFYLFDTYVPLFGEDDNENENLILLTVFQLIKYRYFMKMRNINR